MLRRPPNVLFGTPQACASVIGQVGLLLGLEEEKEPFFMVIPPFDKPSLKKNLEDLESGGLRPSIEKLLNSKPLLVVLLPQEANYAIWTGKEQDNEWVRFGSSEGFTAPVKDGIGYPGALLAAFQERIPAHKFWAVEIFPKISTSLLLKVQLPWTIKETCRTVSLTGHDGEVVIGALPERDNTSR